MQFKLDGGTRLHLFFIVLATFLAFGVVLGGYFIADDTWQLQFAYRVFHGEWALVTGNFVRSYLSLPSMDFYRPLLGITYLIDYALYGLSAAGFYLTNILLAALAGIFLYFIGRALSPAMDETRSKAFAFISALLFVVSPLHCEDVCWISGRADLLAAPFFLGGLLSAIYARDWKSGAINWRYYIFSLLAFIFALMSKESAVTLPLVVAALFLMGPDFVNAKKKYFWSAGDKSSRDDFERGVLENDGVRDGKDQAAKKRKKKIGGGRAAGDIEKQLQAREKNKQEGARAADSASQNLDKSKTAPSSVNAAAEALIAKTKPPIDWSAAIKKFVLFLSPYGVITIIYLLVRQKALGSFVGGYTGDMGEALSKWLIFRWFDPLNLVRMAFPVAKDCFHPWHIKVYQTPSFGLLGTVYAIIFSIFLVRVLTQRLQWKLPLFLMLWLLASLVPLVKLWGLDASLHNQRVLYLYTAPMVMILPALVFLPAAGPRSTMQKNFFVLTPLMEEFITDASKWAFYALTSLLVVFASLASYSWVMAGKQVQGIQQKATALIESQKNGPDKKVLLVRVPKDYLGAHVLMGGVNLLELLEPPFLPRSISEYMVGFQRALVGPGEPVNSWHLKTELSMLHDPKAFFWQTDKADFKCVHYDPPAPTTPQSIDLPVATSAAQAGQPGLWFPSPLKKARFMKLEGAPGLAFEHLEQEGGDGLIITGLDINPLAFDYVNVVISMPRVQEASGIYVSFDDCDDAKQPFVDQPQVCKLLHITKVPTGGVLRKTLVNVKVSHYGDWFSYKKIKRMKISFSNIDAIGVSQISISDDRLLVPRFFVVGSAPRACGEYFCDGQPIKFAVDAAMMKEAKNCLVEISKVNQSWDTFLTEEVNGRDNVVSSTCRVPLAGGQAVFKIDPKYYAQTGFYDLRAVLINDKNEMISDWSELLTLYRPDRHGSRAPFCADY